MKRLILAGVVFVLATAHGVADEASSVEDDRATDAANAQLNPAANLATEDAASAEVSGDVWQPHFMVSLETSEHALSGPLTDTVSVPYYKTAEYVERRMDDGRVSKVAVRKLAYRKETVTIHGRHPATLYCDDINIRLANSEGGGSEFDCPGKLHLFIGAMSISAESGSLKDGKLQLTNAKIKQWKTTASAEKLVLTMPLLGVSAVAFNAPVPEGSMLMPFVPRSEDGDRTFLKPKRDDGFLLKRTFRGNEPPNAHQRSFGAGEDSGGFSEASPSFGRAEKGPPWGIDPLPKVIP